MNDEYNLGIFLIVFVGIIVGLALIPAMASFVGTGVNTVSVVNVTYTTAANGSAVDLTGQEILVTPVAHNSSGGEIVTSANLTFSEGISTTTGQKTILMTTVNTLWAGEPVNVTYSYGADGYIDNAGGRSIAGLIVLFACLGVAAISLYPVLKSKVLDM